MRDGRAKVCVATDVAARGIDLPNLELVIHAELPTNAETLLHRSGRTGRAGRKGVSALIAPAKMKRRAMNLLSWGKLEATWANPPTADEVTARDQERLLEDPVWTEDVPADIAEFAAKLVALHAPEKIAAAYLRLFAGNNSRQSICQTTKTAHSALIVQIALIGHQKSVKNLARPNGSLWMLAAKAKQKRAGCCQ